MDSKWIVSDVPAAEQINAVAEKTGASRLLSAIMCVRGFSADGAKTFLDKDFSCIHDPFIMKDMDKAVERLKKAISHNEKITIYGDYDADGVTSCSLMVQCIRELGGLVDYYIPERETEGYGVSVSSIDIIYGRGTTLIVTVDCGITATEECEYAKNLGIDMIITDHHECGSILPDAVAVVDPKRSDCEYPFKALAGVGVALKLVQALLADKYTTKQVIDKYCELVTIGSVADIVPLTGENRVICEVGLKKIPFSKNYGIRALLDVSGVTDNVTAVKIGFVIAPKINAVGRLESATRAIELFLSESKTEAEKIASELNDYNTQRQKIEYDIYVEAEKMLLENYADDKIAVLQNENWHHGVVGIVSSRLTKRYMKPCILISPGADGLYKGSGRSVDGFSLYDALDYSSDFLETFGGHELAAGLVIKSENVDAFRKKINEYAENNLNPDMMISVINADCELRSRHLNLKEAEELKKMEPYGVGNAQPVFYISGLTVQKVMHIGNEGQHLKLSLIKDGIVVDTIGFGLGKTHDIVFGSTVSVMCNLDVNEFRGNRSVQLKIIDIK